MSVVKSKQKPSGFEPVDLTKKIYEKTLYLCEKMPRRYTDLLLRETVECAGRVMDCAIAGNSLIPQTLHEYTIRRDYWLKAKANLSALATRMNRFRNAPNVLTYKVASSGKIKGVTINEIKELLDLIDRENFLLKSLLDREFKYYTNKLPIERN